MVSRINYKGRRLAACLLSLLCLAMLLASLQSTTYAQGQIQHVVKAGDTLYFIALQYDTRISAIRALNGLAADDYLRVGQVLEIPGTADSDASDSGAPIRAGCAARHTVVAKDSLLALSVQYDVAADAIAHANDLSDTNYLYIGQPLCIPFDDTVPLTSAPSTSAPTPVVFTSKTYVVKGGDNLFRIALNHGVSLDALRRANGLAADSFINPGQRLIIPTGGTVAPPVTPATPMPTPVASKESIPDVSVNAYTTKFFNNATLSGTPVLTRVEAAPLNQNWGREAPGAGVIADEFSASFEGRFHFEAATYRFITVVDDGMKLYIDGVLVKDAWQDQPAASYSVDVVMTAGSHTVRLEYYDNQWEASIALRWLKLLAADAAPPPTPTPTPTVQSTPEPTAPAATLKFAYGIQAHALGRGNAAPVLNHVDDLGFTWLKQQVRWEDMERQRGVRQWDELDELLAQAQRRDVHVLFSVVTAPQWARERNADLSVAGPPANNAEFAAYIGDLAKRYCGGPLKAIEVWNEQNLHYEWGNLPLDARAYVNLLQAASGAIRRNCPSLFIISGALTPAGNNGSLAVDDFTYMEQMLQAGLATYVDGIGAHPSGFNVPPNVLWQQACGAIQQYGNSFNGACDTPHHSWSFRSTMEGYRNLAVNHGAAALPIVATEFGWAAGGKQHPNYGYADDNSFQEQADWTVKAFSMMRDWDWTGPAFLWNLNFRVVANGTERAQWGIVNPDWSPLPVYTALKRIDK